MTHEERETRQTDMVAPAFIAEFGFCPLCAEPGIVRNLLPNPHDKCATGHFYPSCNAIGLDAALRGPSGEST